RPDPQVGQPVQPRRLARDQRHPAGIDEIAQPRARRVRRIERQGNGLDGDAGPGRDRRLGQQGGGEGSAGHAQQGQDGARERPHATALLTSLKVERRAPPEGPWVLGGGGSRPAVRRVILRGSSSNSSASWSVIAPASFSTSTLVTARR